MSEKNDLRRRVVAETLAIAPALPFAFLVFLVSPSWVEVHAEGFRCIRDPHTLSLWNFWRWVAGVCAVLCVFLIRPLLVRRLRDHGIDRAACARIVLAILAALVTSEVVLRRPWHHEPPGPPAFCDYCPPVTGDPAAGWKLEASKDFVWHVGEVDVHYRVDADGNRARAVSAMSDPKAPTIVVAGESVAMGMASPYEQTFPAMLEDDLHVQVIDAAVHGYDMGQAYARAADVARPLERMIAFVTLFVPEEAEREDFDDRAQWWTTTRGLELEPPPSPRLQDLELRKLWKRLYHSTARLDAMKGIARATAEIARQKGAYALFVTTNYAEPCLDVQGKSPGLFRELFDDQGLAHVHVPLTPDDRLHDDPHPGERGHRKLADAIEAALKRAHAL